MTAIDFVYDDGGRAEAGFKGEAGDCVTRAIAIATAIPYRTVYAELHADLLASTHSAGSKARSPRNAVPRAVSDAWLERHGWSWTPTMAIGSGCVVHLDAGELPITRVVVARLSKHLATVIDGVLHDTHDCSRDGTRCVYGYWTRP